MILRIEKYISDQLGIGRTNAKKCLFTGKVSVNGATVTKSGVKVDTEKDLITVEGEPIHYKKYVYLLLNKPSGVLSASHDKNTKTVLDLVPEQYNHRKLFAVGRLDKDTTGLIIITDDGDFAHKVISPKSHINKTYSVTLDGDIPSFAVEEFKKGLTLHSGEKCLPAKLEIISEKTARVTICEGKYHQIKRMFGVFGLGVKTLHRESIGNLKLPNSLNFGEICELEISNLGKIC